MMGDTIPNDKGTVYVQPSGGGNPLKLLMGNKGDAGRVGALSGGGASVEPLFAFGRKVGMRKTGNEAPFTGDFATRREAISELRKLWRQTQCGHALYVFSGCSPQDVDKYSLITVIVDFFVTDISTSNDLVDGITGETADQMDVVGYTALDMFEIRQLAASLQGGLVTTGALNHIINISNPHCSGPCGSGDTGENEFLAVGDPQAPATIPRIHYTGDSGVTWVSQTIAAVANGAAEAVAVAGNRVLVAASGTNGGIYTASLTDVKLGTAVFTLATGIVSGNAYNDIIALDAATIVAVGASGRVALSTDGGYSFSALTSGVATALNSVSGGSDNNLVWIGGASATVLRLKNLSTIESITVAGIGADAVNVVRVPYDRTNEVYIGTATGEIHRSRNTYDPTPSWSELNFDKPTGGGVIQDIQFTETRQQIMTIIQTDATPDSRAMIDISGGYGAKWMFPVGTFASPANNIINSIAPANVNFMLMVGELAPTNAFFGKIAG